MVLVKMNEDVVLTSGPVESGDEVDVSPDVAAALVEAGTADYVNDGDDPSKMESNKEERTKNEDEESSEREDKSRRQVNNTVNAPDPTGNTPRTQTDVERQVTPQRPKPRTE